MAEEIVFGATVAFAGTGLTLGLAAGLAPGPLTTLVVSQTVRFGAREGAKVACAPVITDGPLVLLAAWLLHQLAGLDTALGAIALVGAGFLVWLAWDAASAAGIEVPESAIEEAKSVRKSVLTNLLNPHPYLFWFTVGGPLTVEAGGHGWGAASAFLVGFFGAIVGAKLAIAALVGRIRAHLGGAAYRWTMRALAASMLVFAALFVREGLRLLG